MEIELRVGFTYDARGRMVETNEPFEPGRRPAPRLVVGETAAGRAVRFGATLPDAVVRELAEQIARGAPRAAWRDILARHAPISDETAGPYYRYPDAIAVPGHVVEVTAANVALARATYPWLLDELPYWAPYFGVVEDGAIVSICFSARRDGVAAAAGVDTLAAYRGRGHASAVAAAWGAAIRASGRIALYSTSHANLASQGVARRIGLVQFGVAASWS